MTNLIDFLTKTNNINGVSFVSLRGYHSSTSGEVSNVTLNIGKDLYKNAQAKDLKAMQNTNANDMFEDFSFENKTIPFDIFKKAFDELYNSFVPVGGKCIDGSTKKRSNQSYGQINAYTKINNSVKVHNDKNRLYLYGLTVKKEVLVEGVYPTSRPQKKTVCKNFIKKQMQFKTSKFRNYIIEGADVLNLSKTSFEGSELSISL
jgi:hypothetical protein